MPSTTNFGWTTPADTDLVKDGAAAIRTLGNGIDTSLVDLKGGTTGQVLSKASNTDLDFTWVAQDDSNAIQNALLTTTGDTIYASSASTPARLGIGSTGQVLTVSGGVPVWASPAGGGKVLQVVSATYDTLTDSTSQTYADSGLTVNITPSSASSKVLVLVAQQTKKEGNTGVFVQLNRGATGLIEMSYIGYDGTTNDMYGIFSMCYLDSPATTSATTYKTQFKRGTASGTARINTSKSVITVLEIGA